MDEAKIITLESVDSTNDYLKSHSDLREDFLTVRAVEQTRGRGRLSRSWHSAPGKDLVFSFVFSPDRAVNNIGVYSLVCGMALHRVVGAIVGSGLDLQWPNDLFCRGRKMAGILCEAVYEERPVVIAGIGVNVNSRIFPERLMGNATSLAIETGTEHDLVSLMRLIIGECRRMISGLEIPLLPEFVDEWARSCSSIGRTAVYSRGGTRASGTVRSIDGNGYLVVADHETGRDYTVMDEVIIPDA
ncbi:MAG TPA: biotin--[acetyl-CoA-carboxylase] ligase [Spirochaetota bacterium]|nr:biotin--[acetyl-CoA-carboxylase] ligase [Spirochaetota bacterium]HSA14983.1 biotin--[acetyl-CoA-carboxylase] ligase [Spirochaetota bacterium]